MSSFVVTIIAEVYFRNIVDIFGSVVSRRGILLVDEILLVLVGFLQFFQGLLSCLLLGGHVLEVGDLVGAFRDGPLILKFLESPFLFEDVDEDDSHQHEGNEMQSVVN